MRKILLATTAIVAMGAGSAMAADVTISGSFEFGYNDDSGNANSAVSTVDSAAYTTEQDVNIKFSSTTDSGLTMSMDMGLHENSTNDDLNATLAGDFGSLRFTSGADDDAVEGIDISVAAATSEEGTAAATSNTPVYAGGFSATAGNSVSYTLPTLVEGLTIAASSNNGTGTYGGAEGTGYGAKYATSAGGAAITLAIASSSTNSGAAATTKNVKKTHYGLSVVSGDITVMAESNTQDKGDSADYSSTGIGAKYVMGAITIGAYNRTAKTGTADEEYSQTAYGIDYTIAPGLTASVTTTSTDKSSTISVDRTRASLKMAF